MAVGAVVSPHHGNQRELRAKGAARDGLSGGCCYSGAYIKLKYSGSPMVHYIPIWVVVKIMVPFWVPKILGAIIL